MAQYIYEIYNYKTGDTAGVSFPTKAQAQNWVNRRKAETSLRLFWRVRRVRVNPNPSLTLHIPPRLAGKIKIKTNGKGIRVRRQRLANPVSSYVDSWQKFTSQTSWGGRGYKYKRRYISGPLKGQIFEAYGRTKTEAIKEVKRQAGE